MSSSLETNTTTNNNHIIICAGLNCLDLQLIGCTKSGQEEAIEQYEKAIYCAGGSACMAATTLSLLNQISTTGKMTDSSETTTTNSAKSYHTIHVLTKLGNDRNGEIMLDFMTQSGVKTDLTFMDDTVATAMSVLPIFKTGGRGCYFNLASNNSFTKEEVMTQLEKLKTTTTTTTTTTTVIDAFLFGYPHLMPQLQGENLKSLLEQIKNNNNNNNNDHPILIGVDLNGVSVENHTDTVLGPALPYVDVLHLNEEEAEILSGEKKVELMKSQDKLQMVANKLHDNNGCAIVVLSLGSKGAFISVTSDTNRLNNNQCPKIITEWGQQQPQGGGNSVHIPAFAIDGEVNANGAGDALFAGFCFAVATASSSSSSSASRLTLQQAGTFASLVARQRCDIRTRDAPSKDYHELLEMVLQGGDHLPPTLS